MKLIIKILITLLGAVLIFTDLKENNTWILIFCFAVALFMTFEGFFYKKKNPQ